MSGRMRYLLAALLAVSVFLGGCSAQKIQQAFTVSDHWKPSPGPGETLPDYGREHAPVGTALQYETEPPTSGKHYDQWAKTGQVYEDLPAAGLVVHSLEHGNIAIYFDPTRFSAAERHEFDELVQQHPGSYDGLLGIPRPDNEYPFILTAWRKRLKLTQWDKAQVDAFLKAYLGRGPESPPDRSKP